VSPAAKQPKPKPKAAPKAKAAKAPPAESPPREEPADERVLELEHAPPELSRVILHRLARGR
jgi:hypothetical protein